MSNSNYESLSKEELLALIQQRDKVIAKQEKAALTLKDTINRKWSEIKISDLPVKPYSMASIHQGFQRKFYGSYNQ